MTHALPPTAHISPLQAQLTSLGRQRRAYAFWAGVVRAIWLGALVALAFILLDAAMALPTAARFAAAAIIGLIVFLGSIASVHWRSRPDREALHDARIIERKHRLWRNPLINALYLAHLADDPADDLPHQLARRCVDRGRQALAQVNVQAVIDRAALHRELGWLWAVCVAWMVLGIVQPRLVFGGLQRIISPSGIQMPFSLTQIDVEVNPPEVYEGDAATVWAHITGRIPDQAQLVELDAAGNELKRWPMQPVDPASHEDAGASAPLAAGVSFERRLQDLREPITFRVEAGTAQSQPFTITPKPRPVEPATDESSQAPNPPDPGSSDDPGRQSAEPSQPPEQDAGPSLSELFPELFNEIAGLSEMVNPLGEQAQKLFTDLPDDLESPEGQQWLKDLEAFEKNLAKFRQRAGELAEEARKLGRDNPEHQPALEALAQQLESLSLCQLGQCPNPGAGEGATPGAGGGGATPANGSSGYWVMGAQQAGAADQSVLRQLLVQLQRPLTEQTSDGHSQLPDVPVGAPGGTYREHVAGTGEASAPDGVMQQVPPQYRELVRRYYDRVQQDETQRSPAP